MKEDFSKRILTVIFIITVLLMIVQSVFFFFTGTYMEQLFHDWMAYIFGGECLILGLIKVTKVGAETYKEKQDKIKQEMDALKQMAESEAGK